MCCQSFNGGYQKKKNLPALGIESTRGRSACTGREGEWRDISLLSSRVWEYQHSFQRWEDEGSAWEIAMLRWRYMLWTLQPTARLFRWLLHSRDSKTRQGTFHTLPTSLWWTLIHCIWELGPNDGANDFDLMAFNPTLPRCERSKVQTIGELWPWLQACLRS